MDGSDGFRRLSVEIQKRALFDAGMCGEDAYSVLLDAVGRLAEVETDELVGRNPNGYARRHLRYLAAILPSSVPDGRVADVLCYVIGNDRVTVSVIREVLAGRNGEIPASTLRAVVGLLREGINYRDAAEMMGVGANTARDLSAFFAVPQARVQVLQSEARRAVEQGQTVQQFMQDHGIGRRLALRLLREAREVAGL